jgi:hypothetical protein
MSLIGEEATALEVHATLRTLVATRAANFSAWAEYATVLLDPQTEAFFSARLPGAAAPPVAHTADLPVLSIVTAVSALLILLACGYGLWNNRVLLQLLGEQGRAQHRPISNTTSRTMQGLRQAPRTALMGAKVVPAAGHHSTASGGSGGSGGGGSGSDGGGGGLRLLEQSRFDEQSDEISLTAHHAAVTLCVVCIFPCAFVWSLAYTQLAGLQLQGGQGAGARHAAPRLLSAACVCPLLVPALLVRPLVRALRSRGGTAERASGFRSLEAWFPVLMFGTPLFMHYGLGGFRSSSAVILWMLMAPILSAQQDSEVGRKRVESKQRKLQGARKKCKGATTAAEAGGEGKRGTAATRKVPAARPPAKRFCAKRFLQLASIRYMIAVLVALVLMGALEINGLVPFVDMPRPAVVSFFVLNIATTSVITVFAFATYASKLREQQEDISERRKMEAARRTFLSSFSHELRTPLAGVIGMISLVQELDNLPPLAAHYMQKAAVSAHLLMHLANDILDMSRIEAGQLQMRPVLFNLRRAVKSVMDLVVSEAKMKNLALTLVIADGVPSSVSADVIRFRQVLLNLLSNAIKFTLQGAVQVRVSLDVPPEPSGPPSPGGGVTDARGGHQERRRRRGRRCRRRCRRRCKRWRGRWRGRQRRRGRGRRRGRRGRGRSLFARGGGGLRRGDACGRLRPPLHHLHEDRGRARGQPLRLRPRPLHLPADCRSDGRHH